MQWLGASWRSGWDLGTAHLTRTQEEAASICNERSATTRASLVVAAVGTTRDAKLVSTQSADRTVPIGRDYAYSP